MRIVTANIFFYYINVYFHVKKEKKICSTSEIGLHVNFWVGMCFDSTVVDRP